MHCLKASFTFCWFLEDIKGILPYYAYLGYRITRVVCVKAVSGKTKGLARCGLYTYNKVLPTTAFTHTTRVIRYPRYAKYGNIPFIIYL